MIYVGRVPLAWKAVRRLEIPMQQQREGLQTSLLSRLRVLVVWSSNLFTINSLVPTFPQTECLRNRKSLPDVVEGAFVTLTLFYASCCSLTATVGRLYVARV
jgi:hypothetical protein